MQQSKGISAVLKAVFDSATCFADSTPRGQVQLLGSYTTTGAATIVDTIVMSILISPSFSAKSGVSARYFVAGDASVLMLRSGVEEWINDIGSCQCENDHHTARNIDSVINSLSALLVEECGGGGGGCGGGEATIKSSSSASVGRNCMAMVWDAGSLRAFNAILTMVSSLISYHVLYDRSHYIIMLHRSLEMF